MALCALAKSQSKDPSIWSPDDLEQIMSDGDNLYGETCRKKNVTYLLSTIPKILSFDNIMYKVMYKESICGTLDSTSTNGPFSSLNDALDSLSVLTWECAIFTVGKASSSPAYSSAIIHNNNNFYVFDSHSRGDTGMLLVNGTGVLLETENLYDLIAYIKDLCKEGEGCCFELIPVKIQPFFMDESDSSQLSVISDGAFDCQILLNNENCVEQILQITSASSNEYDHGDDSDASNKNDNRNDNSCRTKPDDIKDYFKSDSQHKSSTNEQHLTSLSQSDDGNEFIPTKSGTSYKLCDWVLMLMLDWSYDDLFQ
jgi:hypothetical protein